MLFMNKMSVNVKGNSVEPTRYGLRKNVNILAFTNVGCMYDLLLDRCRTSVAFSWLCVLHIVFCLSPNNILHYFIFAPWLLREISLSPPLWFDERTNVDTEHWRTPGYFRRGFQNYWDHSNETKSFFPTLSYLGHKYVVLARVMAKHENFFFIQVGECPDTEDIPNEKKKK